MFDIQVQQDIDVNIMLHKQSESKYRPYPETLAPSSIKPMEVLEL